MHTDSSSSPPAIVSWLPSNNTPRFGRVVKATDSNTSLSVGFARTGSNPVAVDFIFAFLQGVLFLVELNSVFVRVDAVAPVKVCLFMMGEDGGGWGFRMAR